MHIYKVCAPRLRIFIQNDWIQTELSYVLVVDFFFCCTQYSFNQTINYTLSNIPLIFVVSKISGYYQLSVIKLNSRVYNTVAITMQFKNIYIE
jgi:hypothetical protein